LLEDEGALEEDRDRQERQRRCVYRFVVGQQQGRDGDDNDGGQDACGYRPDGRDVLNPRGIVSAPGPEEPRDLPGGAQRDAERCEDGVLDQKGIYDPRSECDGA